MNTRIVLATVSGAAVITLLAGLFFGFLFADFFQNSLPERFAGVNREVPNVGLIVAADLLYAGMLVYLFEALAGIDTFRRGAMSGAIIGFLVMAHFALLSGATTYLTTPASAALEIAVSTFMSAMGGGVVGAMLGRQGR